MYASRSSSTQASPSWSRGKPSCIGSSRVAALVESPLVSIAPSSGGGPVPGLSPGSASFIFLSPSGSISRFCGLTAFAELVESKKTCHEPCFSENLPKRPRRPFMASVSKPFRRTIMPVRSAIPRGAGLRATGGAGEASGHRGCGAPVGGGPLGGAMTGGTMDGGDVACGAAACSDAAGDASASGATANRTPSGGAAADGTPAGGADVGSDEVGDAVTTGGAAAAGASAAGATAGTDSSEGACTSMTTSLVSSTDSVRSKFKRLAACSVFATSSFAMASKPRPSMPTRRSLLHTPCAAISAPGSTCSTWSGRPGVMNPRSQPASVIISSSAITTSSGLFNFTSIFMAANGASPRCRRGRRASAQRSRRPGDPAPVRLS
mmetsp:Transcript_102404/g.298597  ORF Transcript_102404/g.298597 Transcript_102404/m.298597 type:complete len:378 (-) Transcript_102404:8-1141(-)